MMPALAVRAALVFGVVWQPVAAGVWHAELPVATRGPLSAVRVIAVRLDPARVHFGLDTATRDMGTRSDWTIDRLPADGLLAFNTSQFIGGVTWGWLVHEGVELREPGTGPLSMALVVDSMGGASLITPAQLAAARGHVRLAIQSYPAVLTGNGEVPWQLLAPGRGVDLEHRDSRLAIGVMADGSVVVALTRFTGLGSRMEQLPWGPTVTEMARLMQSLGCRQAMLLDGGISSQMVLRTDHGRLHRWANWRKVPLGMVVTPRPDGSIAEKR